MTVPAPTRRAPAAQVGPPAGGLKGRAPEEWGARQVAEQVLIDRSTARITTGQRVSLNSVEAAAREEREGVTYFVFEHVSQVGSLLCMLPVGRPGRASPLPLPPSPWFPGPASVPRGGRAAALGVPWCHHKRRVRHALAATRQSSWRALAAATAAVQGSPTLRSAAKETYRHALAVTGAWVPWDSFS